MRIDATLPPLPLVDMQPREEPRDKTYGLGAVIKDCRTRRGITQKALADAIGVERTSITNIERGTQRVMLHSLVQIAEALDMELTIKLAPRVTSGVADAAKTGDEQRNNTVGNDRASDA